MHPLADGVFPLTYAPYGSAAYRLMHDYKIESTPNQFKYIDALKYFLQEELARHLSCLSTRYPVTAVSVVPSTSNPGSTDHSLGLVVEGCLQDLPRIGTFFTKPRAQRKVDPYYAQFPKLNRDELSHVLVFEDTWVTGSTSQSVAAGLKMRGAKRVSIVPLARALDPRTSVVNRAIDALRQGQFDWNSCPFCGQAHA